MPDSGSDPRDPGAVASLRSITTHVRDGLSGALRVMTTLHGRRYTVRNVTIEVREGLAGSRVTCTVVVTSAQAGLLLERLRRMPAVVSVHHA